MILYKMYKHINNKDVGFRPTGIFEETEDHIEYYGKWYNIIHEPFPISEDVIKVKKEDLDKWKKISS